jgi:hypothetical protein
VVGKENELARSGFAWIEHPDFKPLKLSKKTLENYIILKVFEDHVYLIKRLDVSIKIINILNAS